MSLFGVGQEPVSSAGIGCIVREGHNRVSRACVPSPAPAGQTLVIDVGGAEASEPYSIRVAGGSFDHTVSVVTAGSTSADLLGGQLEAAWNADAIAGGIGSLTFDAATDKLTLVLADRDVSFVVTFPANPTDDLTIDSDTAATDGAQFLYGRAAQVTTGSGGPARLTNELAQLLVAPTSQVVLFDIGHSASQAYEVSVNLIGPEGLIEVVDIAWAAGGNAGATAIAAKAAIDAALAGYMSSAVATNDVNVTMFPGFQIVQATVPTAGTGTLELDPTTPAGAFLEVGIVQDDKETSVSLGLYEPRTPVGPAPGTAPLIFRSGAEIAVQSPGSVTAGGPVYAECAAGANQGRLYTTASATRILVPGARWVRVDPLNASLAHVAK